MGFLRYNDDWIDPERVEFFFVEGAALRVYFTSGQYTYVHGVSGEDFAAAVEEAKEPF